MVSNVCTMASVVFTEKLTHSERHHSLLLLTKPSKITWALGRSGVAFSGFCFSVLVLIFLPSREQDGGNTNFAMASMLANIML